MRVRATAMVFVLLGFLLSAQTAWARTCTDDTLRNVSDMGRILVTMIGIVYQVVPGDNIDSMLWLPGESLTVCDDPMKYRGHTVMVYRVIDTDDGTSVLAERLR